MITYTSDPHQILSQNKTKSKFQFELHLICLKISGNPKSVMYELKDGQTDRWMKSKRQKGLACVHSNSTDRRQK